MTGHADYGNHMLVISTDGINEEAPHQNMAAIWLTSRGWNVTLLGRTTASGAVATPLGAVQVEAAAGPSKGKMYWDMFKKIVGYRWRGTRVFYIQGAPATIASRLALLGVRRSRRIYHTQDFLEPGRHRLMEFFEKAGARRAGWVILNEPSRARFFCSAYRLGQMPTVVRTALPRGWPAPERKAGVREEIVGRFGQGIASQEARLIMAGGQFALNRCSEELMRAVGALPAPYRLVFTGMTEGSPQGAHVKGLAETLGIGGRVCFLPHLSYASLLEHFAACDVGMLLYLNDGVGNYFQQPGRLTEYMLAGLPVVTSNFTGLELMVVKHGLGRAADPQGPEAIAAAVREVCEQSEGDRERQREHLRRLAGGEFAYESQAYRIEEILREAGLLPRAEADKTLGKVMKTKDGGGA